MKNIIVFLISAALSTAVYGQKQANIWYFGNHAGLDFNNIPPTPLLNGQTYLRLPVYGWNEGCSSISDSSGSLLFYTDGENIWNKFHTIMPNGSGLMGHWSSTQSSIIVPQPNSQQYFYVFTTDAVENNYQNGLRYSVVDICLDNGKGAVLANAKNILLTDSLTEKLICIRHANGIDYWIVVHKNNSDAFYTFRLTSTGVVDTIISHTGSIEINTISQAVGQMVASPDGLKIGYAKPSAVTGFTMLLDFDPSTGIVSNGQILNTLNTEYAVSFSPDNSKLYFSTIGHGEIYQYDLNAGNIAAIIASKTYILPSGPDDWQGMQLGPDGKIYIAKASFNYLSVIENPNSLCPACNYIDNAVSLGTQFASFGLPNFIAGFNYSNTIAPCPTSMQQFNNSAQTINIFPNPTQQIINIELPEQETFNLIINDVTGRKIYRSKNATGVIQIDCSNFNGGIYFVQATNAKYILTCKLFKP